MRSRRPTVELDPVTGEPKKGGDWDDTTGRTIAIQELKQAAELLFQENRERKAESQKNSFKWILSVGSTIVLAVAVFTALTQIGACDKHGGFPWPTKTEMTEIIKPIQTDVTELKASNKSTKETTDKIYDLLTRKKK